MDQSPTFASVGMLYEDTFVLFDEETESLWYHLEGDIAMTAISGEYAGSRVPELRLPTRPGMCGGDCTRTPGISIPPVCQSGRWTEEGVGRIGPVSHRKAPSPAADQMDRNYQRDSSQASGQREHNPGTRNEQPGGTGSTRGKIRIRGLPGSGAFSVSYGSQDSSSRHDGEVGSHR